MLEQMGAAGVLALEANSRAYLKCLIMKETFGLRNVHFLLGDFLPYLRGTAESFDVGFACGVLYHLLNPVELIQQLALHCRAVFVWTHFYDPAFMAANPTIAAYFQPGRPASVGGFDHMLYRKGYGAAVQWKGFCGGGANEACWLSSSDILTAFQHFGFKILDQGVEQNPNGPALLFVAERTR